MQKFSKDENTRKARRYVAQVHGHEWTICLLLRRLQNVLGDVILFFLDVWCSENFCGTCTQAAKIVPYMLRRVTFLAHTEEKTFVLVPTGNVYNACSILLSHMYESIFPPVHAGKTLRNEYLHATQEGLFAFYNNSLQKRHRRCHQSFVFHLLGTWILPNQLPDSSCRSRSIFYTFAMAFPIR